MSDADKLLQMGVVGRPHGIKGELRVIWHGDQPAHEGMSVFLQKDDGDPQIFHIAHVHARNGKLLVRLAEINDRDAAEKLNGARVYLSKDSLPPLSSEEAYLADILGCAIALPDGKIIGRLDHVEFPANRAVWSIKTADNKEILFPAHESFIDSFDMANRIVQINPPSGLLEIYDA